MGDFEKIGKRKTLSFVSSNQQFPYTEKPFLGKKNYLRILLSQTNQNRILQNNLIFINFFSKILLKSGKILDLTRGNPATGMNSITYENKTNLSQT